MTWLASWSENILGKKKYMMMNSASKLKGEGDFTKFEIARLLHKHVDDIRKQCCEELKAKEIAVRQRAVALYFIDKVRFFLVFNP